MRSLLAALLVLAGPALAGELVIHEWGTFTSLQDETGRTIGAINSDDEPVPAFVHNLTWQLSVDGRPGGQRANRISQGWPTAHPDVTMRLETPVLYVHGAEPGTKLNVSVEFH